ncbi:HAMP domain-containing sensor histidine kinase [Atopococcus tabaci]|uniref:HAMP domain-containing sensor histidine kinase n=1 Tax=Atopococcus tabaci TaxID=269774 RepID=UPI002409E7F7|nr:ATP-binding protein [Atopococcus tabaci]
MNVNIVAVRLWIYTIGFILFSFLATSLFYGLFYSEQVEDMYLKDFNQIIENVETLSWRDPHFLINSIEDYGLIESKIYYDVRSEEENSVEYGELFEELPSEFRTELFQNESAVEIIESNERGMIHSTLQVENQGRVPFVFRVFPFEVNGTEYTLYSYADVAFLNEIEKRTNTILGWLIVVYLFLSVLYFFYLKKTISDPLHEMTETAFLYAKNDFRKEVPIHGRDDLAQLAMAMNKMGNALETSATAISQERNLLANIMNSIDTGVLYYDKDGTLLQSNPAGELFLQQYRLYKEKYPEEAGNELENRIKEAVEHMTTIHFAMELNDNFYSINVFPVSEEDTQHIRGNIVSIQDLTQEHRLDKTRVDFINNISHELRTPLVMVQGYSEAILDDVAESVEEKKEMASIIRDEAERMNRMVNEMLDLSRMEAGYIDLHKEMVDIGDYFSRLVSRFKTMADEARIQLAYDVSEDVVNCFMDRDKMDQVFVNLLNNAIRHTQMAHPREGGKVTLHAKFDTLVDEVVLEVHDNGSGIPAEDIPFVFDRFYKADKSRENQISNKRGTGIGLSLVKNIVEAHEGFIEVKSEFGKGTSFFIHLPYIEKWEENRTE